MYQQWYWGRSSCLGTSYSVVSTSEQKVRLGLGLGFTLIAEKDQYNDLNQVFVFVYTFLENEVLLLHFDSENRNNQNF